MVVRPDGFRNAPLGATARSADAGMLHEPVHVRPPVNSQSVHCMLAVICSLSVARLTVRTTTLQSGGAAAIAAEETMAMTLQPGPKGILMRCIPRASEA